MRQVMPGNLNDPQQMMRMQQAYGMQMNGDLRKNAMNNQRGFNPYVHAHSLRCAYKSPYCLNEMSLTLHVEEHHSNSRI